MGLTLREIDRVVTDGINNDPNVNKMSEVQQDAMDKAINTRLNHGR